MNLDELEKRIRAVPPRKIPAAWREQILGPLRQSQIAAPLPWWKQWLWPHPAAWASLAAAWVAILVLHIAGAADPAPPSIALSKPAPEMLQAFEERVRLVAELSAEPASDTARSPADRPRSCKFTTEVAV